MATEVRMVEYACPALPSGWSLLVAALPGRQVVHTVIRAGQPGDLGWPDPVALTLPNHRGPWLLGWYSLLLYGSDIAKAGAVDGQVRIDPLPGVPLPTAAGQPMRVDAGMEGR
jgi:hypothetical protein